MNNWCICWFSCIPLNAELNPICHLLALLEGATIVVVSRLRVKQEVGWAPGLPWTLKQKNFLPVLGVIPQYLGPNYPGESQDTTVTVLQLRTFVWGGGE